MTSAGRQVKNLMKTTRTIRQRWILCLLAASLVPLLAGLGTREQVRAQDSPWSIESLLTGLKLAKGDKMRLDDLINTVRLRGVDFVLTEEKKKLLTDAQASPKLLEEIEKNCRGAACKPTPKRIKFPIGATQVEVTGTLNGRKDSQTYLLRLRAGQTLKIVSNAQGVTEGVHAITVGVTSPRGEDLNDPGMGCNGNADISPTVAGDYKIEVWECNKVGPWKGTFKMNVIVK